MTVGELRLGDGYGISDGKKFAVCVGPNTVLFSLTQLKRNVITFDPFASCPEPTFFIPPELV